MPSDFSLQTQEFTDANGVKLVVFKIGPREKENLLKDIIISGTEIVSEAIILACSWKLDFHLAWFLIVSVMAIVSFLGFCKNVENYTAKLPYRQRWTLWYSCWVIAGTYSYFLSIYFVSDAVKRSSNIWIPCLGFAAYYYYFSLKAVIELGKTLLKRSPFTKCCQLLYGPMVIGSATYYLSFQQHEEKWVLCLPMITSAIVAYKISAAGYRRFQGCVVEIPAPVFYCICKMIAAPIFLTLGCLGIIFTSSLMLYVSLVSAGIGLAVLGKSVIVLYDLVPQPVFERYCQQVLGPVVTVYGSLVAAHVGYNIGWRSFLVLMPLISAGIYLTYQGFRKMNRLRQD